MVKFALKISCLLDHIEELSTTGSDFVWNLKLQCKTCNEVDSAWHGISANEEVKARSGPGTFNFQMKCKFCSTFFTIDVVGDSIKSAKSNENDRISEQTIVVFDCRGVEPIEFDPRGGWIATGSESGTKFSDVDFTEDPTSWAGYDEKGQFPVSIDDFKAEFVRA